MALQASKNRARNNSLISGSPPGAEDWRARGGGRQPATLPACRGDSRQEAACLPKITPLPLPPNSATKQPAHPTKSPHTHATHQPTSPQPPPPVQPSANLIHEHQRLGARQNLGSGDALALPPADTAQHGIAHHGVGHVLQAQNPAREVGLVGRAGGRGGRGEELAAADPPIRKRGWLCLGLRLYLCLCLCLGLHAAHTHCRRIWGLPRCLTSCLHHSSSRGSSGRDQAGRIERGCCTHEYSISTDRQAWSAANPGEVIPTGAGAGMHHRG